MEQVELVEQGKVALQFLRVERGAVLAHQRPYVIEVAGARGVVHVALQLEADQALDADHAKAAHRGVALRGPFQQLARQQYEGALDGLLKLFTRNRSYNEGITHKTLLQVFDLLGNDHPLVTTYRRKLFAALY